MSVQFLEIAGQQMAVMAKDDYDRLLELAEEQHDIDAAVEAERRLEQGEETVPDTMVKAILAGETPLRAWRKHRGLTLDRLGEMSGVAKSSLSSAENAKRGLSMEAWRFVADALDVLVDDILPIED